MDYEAIVFDMDGVLVTGYHTDPAVYEEASEQVLRSYGVDPATADEELLSPSSIESFQEACVDADLPPDEVWGDRERATDRLENERIAAGDRRLFEDVDVLDSLSAGLGIVSNNRQGTVDFVVDRFELPMQTAYGRAPTFAGYDRMKPDPHYLERAVEDLDVPPHSVLYVGDRHSDVQTAVNAGCDAALLERDGPVDGNTDPTVRIDSLSDLS